MLRGRRKRIARGLCLLNCSEAAGVLDASICASVRFCPAVTGRDGAILWEGVSVTSHQSPAISHRLSIFGLAVTDRMWGD